MTPSQAAGMSLGVLFLLLCANAGWIHFGGHPFMYCDGVWLVYASGIATAYSAVRMLVVLYLLYLLMRHRHHCFHTHIGEVCAIGVFLMLPVWAEVVTLAGSTCAGEIKQPLVIAAPAAPLTPIRPLPSVVVNVEPAPVVVLKPKLLPPPGKPLELHPQRPKKPAPFNPWVSDGKTVAESNFHWVIPSNAPIRRVPTSDRGW